jgi:hypothetical protein
MSELITFVSIYIFLCKVGQKHGGVQLTNWNTELRSLARINDKYLDLKDSDSPHLLPEPD